MEDIVPIEEQIATLEEEGLPKGRILIELRKSFSQREIEEAYAWHDKN